MNDPQGGGTGSASATGQVREKAGEVAQNIRDMGSGVRDAAREQYDQLRGQASDYYEQGRARAQEWEQGLETYVQDKPLQALAIAAGVGLLVGLLWRRS
jgi:ElaB/YqjD/DUF883 family membrane-anchored ribosome-binding protein